MKIRVRLILAMFALHRVTGAVRAPYPSQECCAALSPTHPHMGQGAHRRKMRHAKRALERHQEDLSMAQRQRCTDGLQPHGNSSWWRLGGILHASCAPVPAENLL